LRFTAGRDLNPRADTGPVGLNPSKFELEPVTFRKILPEKPAGFPVARQIEVRIAVAVVVGKGRR
jgi:hypothetical protein